MVYGTSKGSLVDRVVIVYIHERSRPGHKGFIDEIPRLEVPVTCLDLECILK